MQLVGADRDQAGEDGEEARGVEREAEPHAGAGDDRAAERGAEDARGVEEARVERDRVRQLGRADHPVGERLPRRRVEHLHGALEGGDRIDVPGLGDPGEGDRGKRGGEGHRRRLRHDDRAARVEPVDENAGEESEDRERQELGQREHADRERRAGEREHEPRLRDPLHPRPWERDELAGEEEPVVPMLAQAREGAAVEAQELRAHAGRGSSSRRASGSIASSTAVSSSGSRV